MNYLLALTLIVIVFFLMTNREGFTEAFGLSGHSKPVPPVKLNDPKPDLSKYKKVEANVNNDMIEEFVLQANHEISKRTGMCTYIIETTTIDHYKGEDKDIYECMFMTIKKDGFSFGFSIVASFEVENEKVRLVSLRSQPMGVDAPEDVSAFTEGFVGKEFIEYELMREVAHPSKSEFDSVKNKLKSL
jgi:hypothetical protein